jgi:hypothetical protein
MRRTAGLVFVRVSGLVAVLIAAGAPDFGRRHFF